MLDKFKFELVYALILGAIVISFIFLHGTLYGPIFAVGSCFIFGCVLLDGILKLVNYVPGDSKYVGLFDERVIFQKYCRYQLVERMVVSGWMLAVFIWYLVKSS